MRRHILGVPAIFTAQNGSHWNHRRDALQPSVREGCKRSPPLRDPLRQDAYSSSCYHVCNRGVRAAPQRAWCDALSSQQLHPWTTLPQLISNPRLQSARTASVATSTLQFSPIPIPTAFELPTAPRVVSTAPLPLADPNLAEQLDTIALRLAVAPTTVAVQLSEQWVPRYTIFM